MGTWGTGLFDDDTTSDARSAFADGISDGLSASEIRESILDEYAEDPSDPASDTGLWLALAVLQSEHGILERLVRERALKIIDDGLDLSLWEGSDREERAIVLEGVRAKILSGRPKASVRSRRVKASCDWGEGDLVGYALESGNWCVFWVGGFEEDRGGRYPVVFIFDWTSDVVDRFPLDNFPELCHKVWSTTVFCSAVVPGEIVKEIPSDKIHILGREKSGLPKPRSVVILDWDRIDFTIHAWFGLE